jgi:hypothetical protein
VLARCAAISHRSAWAVRPSAAGVPFSVLARGSVPASAWAVRPSAASERFVPSPSGSHPRSCPTPAARSQRSLPRCVASLSCCSSRLHHGGHCSRNTSPLCHGNLAENSLCRRYPAMKSISAMAAFFVSKVSGLVPCKPSSSASAPSAFRPGRQQLAHAVASLGVHPWGSCASPHANPSIERTCHGRLRLPRHAAHVER